MTDQEFENLLRKDRMTPLPDPPELRATLAIVAARAAKDEVPPGEHPGWALVTSAAAVSACALAACLARGFSPLILLIPALQFVTLRALVKKEV